MTRLNATKRHEDWTAEMVRGETEVGSVLQWYGQPFRNEVAELLASDAPIDIYAAIVSSQFDADRLDYVRRDPLMTGARHGGFDCSWLLANLEVDRIAYSRDGIAFREVDELVLGNKAFQAAEAYVLGLFHLYFAVYFHKATRSAEKMLSAILSRIGELDADGSILKSGLDSGHPVIRFVRERSLETYLHLDDSVIWASISMMTSATDTILQELSDRLLKRNLYKIIDVTARFKSSGGEASVARFRSRLDDARASGRFGAIDVFEGQLRARSLQAKRV